MSKIVIINHYGITPNQPGATRHFDMAKFFSEKNSLDVEFWMCGYNHHEGKNEASLKGFKFQSIENYECLKTVKIKSTHYRNSSFLRQLNIIVFDIFTALKILFSKKIDIIILSVPPISIFNVLAIKLKKIKLITDVEDLWPLFLIDMGMKNKFVINYMNFCANLTYRNSIGIEAVSDGMLMYVKTRLKKKIDFLWLSPLGVDLHLYNKDKIKEIDISSKHWKNKTKIIYLGAHGKANGLDQILDVANEIEKIGNKEICFIFIGDGDQKKSLMQYKETLNLHNVYFEDSVASNLVPSYLNLADICLTNLRRIESFKLVRPNKLFQYMAAAKPIISGIWGESEEIIKESKSGISIDFTNTSIAAKQIVDFISKGKEIKQLGINGYEYIKKNGNRDLIFQDFYENMLKILKE